MEPWLVLVAAGIGFIGFCCVVRTAQNTGDAVKVLKRIEQALSERGQE